MRGASEDDEWDEGSYVPLDAPALLETFSDLESLSASNVAARLSLAGTQGKVGLAHLPGHPMGEGWLRPEGGAGSTRSIDSVSEEDFALLARDLGLGARRLRRICDELCSQVVTAMTDAGERLCDTIETLPYTAEDLVSDMESRIAALQRFAGS